MQTSEGIAGARGCRGGDSDTSRQRGGDTPQHASSSQAVQRSLAWEDPLAILRATGGTHVFTSGFTRIALAAPQCMGAGIDSSVNGSSPGHHHLRFRDLPRTPGQDSLNAIIQALQFCRIGEIELYSPNLEPAGLPLPPEPPTPYGGLPRTARPPHGGRRTRSTAGIAKRYPVAGRNSAALPGRAREVRRRRHPPLRLTIGFNDSFTDRDRRMLPPTRRSA